MFDLAHDALDSCEAAIIRLRNLEAFILDSINSRKIKDSYSIFKIKNTAYYMGKLQDVEQLVDEPLFSGKFQYDTALIDVNKFDYDLRGLSCDLEADISRLEGYIVSALGKLPDEIPSGKIRTQRDVLNQELANLYGSSELPSLVASFESKSKDEVLKQAKGVLKILQPLLKRAESLALEHILLRESRFNDWEAGGLGELLDRAHHMFLLKYYIDHFSYQGLAITKFMAGKFDRSAARLDCLLRAYILCYKDLPKDVTPAKLEIQLLRAEYKIEYLEGMSIQNLEDNIALKSLQRKYHDVISRTPSILMAAAHDLEDRAHIAGIEKRRIMARSLRKRGFGDSFCVLGTDFSKDAFLIFHGLIRADMETLEKLISDVEMLKYK